MPAFCWNRGLLLLGLLLLSPWGAADDYDHRVDLIDTTRTVIDQPVVYPEGRARIVSAIVTIPPGESTARHLHDVPLYGYVLAGELTLDYGEHGVFTFSAGDALIEAIDVPHAGTNTGDEPLQILTVFMGSTESRNYIEVK